jgi:hypothetical protein
MELLEKLPDVTVKGDGAKLVKHFSSNSAKENHGWVGASDSACLPTAC